MNFNYLFLIIIGVLGISIFFFIKKGKNKKTENEKEIEEKTKIKPKQNEVKQEIKIPDEIRKLKDYSIIELNNEIKKEIKSAMDLYQLDEETIKEMFKEAIVQINAAKEAIFKSLNEENYDELERQVHSLKGATLNLGFNTFGEPLKYINDNLKNNSLKKEEIKYYLDIIYEKLNAVKI